MYWILPSLVIVIIALLLHKKLFRWIYILAKTLPRDIRLMIIIVKTVIWARKFHKDNYTIPKVFAENVRKHPKKVAFYFENESWTFEKVEEFSNKIANYFDGEGYQRGDIIGLLLENCIAYPAIWLGLSKNGIVTALINTNLVKDSLLHSFEVANCKAIIYGTAQTIAVSDILDKLGSTKLYQFRSKPEEEIATLIGSIDLTTALNNVSPKIIQHKQLCNLDPVLYVFTSGTTGLPKAAVITHSKMIVPIKAFYNVGKMNENDVIYTPLPLYHGAGGFLGVGQVLISGLTCVIRKKFSATNFFNDCAKYNVTIGQYVGELCRYLLAVPKDQTGTYQVRTFFGNGLKPQIWREFVERFGVQRVVEIYGATEGIAFMGNSDGKAGAVGFIPRYLKWISPITNIKCDVITGEPIRNALGHCMECDVGEPGIIIAKVKDLKSVMRYDGYTDKQASNKKMLYNVFRMGDMYFNSGDILKYDEFGYYYFQDRTGDTFRWKGENVSTTEIEAIISNIVHFSDVSVYGVMIPHTDGRAGMAAIVDPKRKIDIVSFGNLLKKNVPSYAMPIFLRVMDSVPLTSTFKLKKNELREEAFNIDKIKEAMYFYHPKFGKYVPLTKDIYDDIQSGNLRL